MLNKSDFKLICFYFLFSVTSIGFTWTLNLTFGQTFYCILYIVVVDFILAGLIVSTLTWIFTNRYLRERVTDADIEWGYCFDVHLNAFFPPLVLLHFVQLLFFNSEFLSHLPSVAHFIYIIRFGMQSCFNAIMLMKLYYLLMFFYGVKFFRCH